MAENNCWRKHWQAKDQSACNDTKCFHCWTSPITNSSCWKDNHRVKACVCVSLSEGRSLLLVGHSNLEIITTGMPGNMSPLTSPTHNLSSGGTLNAFKVNTAAWTQVILQHPTACKASLLWHNIGSSSLSVIITKLTYSFITYFKTRFINNYVYLSVFV